MDFKDTPAEAEFRTRVNKWLRSVAKPKRRNASAHARAEIDATTIAAAKAFQRKKAQAGFAAITWPKEVGGMGGTPIQQVIYNQEEEKFEVPPASGTFAITFGMCMPTMLAYATDEQKAYHVPRALRGEHIWCQLFSEPSAGSDLAGLRTRSERDGDDWVINGQKIWTSGAQFSDYAILVTRSDPTVPKHKGLTYFFLDMKSPGVEVRPIKQISGASHFNEVYFTDVRIPDSQRLGAVGDGWRVALTTLMNERLSIGSSIYGVYLDEFVQMAKALTIDGTPAIEHPVVRDRLAGYYVQTQGIRYTMYRTLTALSKGQEPGPESSIGKAVTAPMSQDMAAFAMDMQGMAGSLLGADQPQFAGLFQHAWLEAPGMRVAGGTDEIMLNIVAERVLGLPADVRVDKDIPFNQLGK
ncbi:MAG: acyl-CoA dehydrogenase family protein [Gammaproteobacteria bacterium]